LQKKTEGRLLEKEGEEGYFMSIFMYCILLVTSIAFCFGAITVAVSIVFRDSISLKNMIFIEMA
jgi:hypothetical protein